MFRSKATLALLLSLMSSFLLANEVIAQPDSEGILEMQEEPLLSVLEAIAALDGREIVVKGNTQGHRVSVVLEHDNLQQNLKRALRGLNYVLAWDTDEKITVWISAAGDDTSGSNTGVVIRPRPVSADPASLFPDSPLVIPPGEEGERGHTEADVAYYRSKQTPLDPSLLEVVPPDENGLGAVTQVEIQRITESVIPLGPKALVLPPAVPGEKGITLEELALIREQNSEDLDLSRRDNVVPPD